jgi:hypothetical protein
VKVKLIGLMVLDEPGMDGAPDPDHPNGFITIASSSRGIEIGTDDRRRDKILNRLKAAIQKLEKGPHQPGPKSRRIFLRFS